ncbi:MAG: DUF2817 domain-containing protein [Planctomycetes bacterium]|nr:DUF2817 domain-containing protein [Planctomycetota bacterium]MBI3848124.1 DUF2817 domain-containing protein [Planctomycetota bacterium]
MRTSRGRVRPTIATSAIVVAMIAGCASTPEATHMTDSPKIASARRAKKPASHVDATSVEGRPIDVVVLGNGPIVVMILATIHGDETAGTGLVRGLERELHDRPSMLQGRRVVLVPVANPDGVARGTRGNAHGVDLNRNFPAANFSRSASHSDAALSEPESRMLERLIRTFGPDRIVSIHQPLACIDWDGPADALAHAMAARSSLPAHRLGGRPGSLGSWAGGTLGTPIVTVELPRSASNLGERDLWDRYGDLLLTAVLFPNAPSSARRAD